MAVALLSSLASRGLARPVRARYLRHPAAACFQHGTRRAQFWSWGKKDSENNTPENSDEGANCVSSGGSSSSSSSSSSSNSNGGNGGSNASSSGAGSDSGDGGFKGNGRKSNGLRARDNSDAQPSGEGVSAQDGAVVPFQGTGLRRDVAPPFDPHLLALPLTRRPLFPGQQQLLQVRNQAVVKEVFNLLEKGTPPFIGTFLKRGDPSITEASQDTSNDSGNATEDLGGADPIESLYTTGTRARIIQAAPNGPNGLQLILHGHDLIKLEKVLDSGTPLKVQVSKIKHAALKETDEMKAYINETMHTIREIMKINPQFREHAAMIHQGLERLERGDPHAIAVFAASLTTSAGSKLMEVLEAEAATEKLRLALVLLKKELELSTLQQKIASNIEEKVSGQQREFLLREQMKQIKKELGEDKNDGTENLLQKFKARLEGKTVSKDVQEAIDSEMEKFSSLAKESQEYQMTRNYLDWLTLTPWSVYSKDTLSLLKAREVLDRDHYGLADVKERILELIAVGSLRGSVQGKILCFVGPPGVGKTSIGRSIAEALGREFYRFSVGGLYDVAEIKGHRRTYVGAMPGKIIQCLKKTQTANPLVLIDEVDKIGRGHQGDPASALLELLDPSQNGSFLDHYLDVPVDCSRILFVCTANVTDTIPGPLLDRMEVIRLSGYDHREKIKIAEQYLVPSAMREVGLWPEVKKQKVEGGEVATDSPSMQEATQPQEQASDTPSEGTDASTPSGECTPQPPTLGSSAAIEHSALESLIRWYCREAGVRNLQKHIEKICRKLATKVVEKQEASNTIQQETVDDADEAAGGKTAVAEPDETADSDLKLTVTEQNLSDFVGKQIFISDRLYAGDLPPGTVTGLAWTSMGGVVLYVEATALARQEGAKAGTPALGVTGQLGSVMKESSQIALLVARRQLPLLAPEASKSFYEEHELFLHCPEGATPKDGPSAGVTMVTALLSLATGKPVRTDLAMTGEVSLNGKVLPVGGIREKTIAARRAGCHVLVYPQANRRDFDELPDYLREGLEVHFASEYAEVFAVALSDSKVDSNRSDASSA